jgi:hypothetical protein
MKISQVLVTYKIEPPIRNLIEICLVVSEMNVDGETRLPHYVILRRAWIGRIQTATSAWLWSERFILRFGSTYSLEWGGKMIENGEQLWILMEAAFDPIWTCKILSFHGS